MDDQPIDIIKRREARTVPLHGMWKCPYQDSDRLRHDQYGKRIKLYALSGSSVTSSSGNVFASSTSADSDTGSLYSLKPPQNLRQIYDHVKSIPASSSDNVFNMDLGYKTPVKRIARTERTKACMGRNLQYDAMSTLQTTPFETPLENDTDDDSVSAGYKARHVVAMRTRKITKADIDRALKDRNFARLRQIKMVLQVDAELLQYAQLQEMRINDYRSSAKTNMSRAPSTQDTIMDDIILNKSQAIGETGIDDPKSVSEKNSFYNAINRTAEQSIKKTPSFKNTKFSLKGIGSKMWKSAVRKSEK